MKTFFHFIKAMYAAFIAYKRGIYFTARDNNEVMWQLSLHSKYCPGLADFDLKNPEKGSMFTHGGNSRTWEPFNDEYSGERFYEVRFNENFCRKEVLAELHVLQMELRKSKGLHAFDDLDEIKLLDKEIWARTEIELKERKSVMCHDPNRITGRKVLL